MMGEIADDDLDRMFDDENERSFVYRRPFRRSDTFDQHQPQWMTVEASHTVNQDDMRYIAVVRIEVVAISKADAYKKVRKDRAFYSWYLKVL